jgi:DNA-binding transcriptional ArsR family regulator
VTPTAPGANDPAVTRLIRGLGHPLRAQIFGVLQERRASPRELADELGAPLSNVSYHVRVLADLKLIRLVKTTPRRGAVEHHYEAVAAARISGKLWAKVPAIARQAITSAALGEIGRAVNAAASLGGFDREDAHLTRTRLVLDERGWAELGAELRRTLARAQQIDRQSQKRLAGRDHEGELRASLVLMLFEDPPRREGSGGANPGEHCHGPRRRADAPKDA